jgi:hypothetical protein
MTDIEICHRVIYKCFQRAWGKPAPEVNVMAIEILQLAERIHIWLNVRVARHLAARAAKLSR